MAKPLRFRYAPGRWTAGRVHNDIYQPLDGNLGAEASSPWFSPPGGFDARRFDMDNGDVALVCWSGDDDGPTGVDGGPAAYWLGNTETPETLWRTDKYGFEEVPYPIARWAQRELLAQLHEESPWLEAYPHLSWFFLPVFLSKDGRQTTRKFFSEYAAGFPDADPDAALSFYESFLQTGSLDPYRGVMAGKLGTSKYFDRTRMTAAMGEFTVGKLLVEAGYEITPEIEVTTGHSIDYRADPVGTEGSEGVLVEVTRPLPPARRSIDSPIGAVRDTAQSKATGQLDSHAGGVVLFVDCSSFPDDDWDAIISEQPAIRHKPALVFRARPDGRLEGYTKGRFPLDLERTIDIVQTA
ncbi:MAG: DUF5784 family protein [Halobacteriota archaeon]